jgi:PAS domain S-box-containing protein
MEDGDRTEEQFIREPAEQSRCVGELGISESEHRQAEKALRESEGRYRSVIDDVIDASPVGIFILDKNFRVVWVNEVLERFFGLQRDKVIGRDKRELIRERIKSIFEDPEAFAEKVLATYETNTYAKKFECHVLPRNEREERWLEHWSQPIQSGFYGGGRVEFYYDITERKLAEEALRASEARLRAIFDGGETVSLIMTDLAGSEASILEFNPGAERIFGYSREEVIGKPVAMLHLPEDVRNFPNVIEAIREKKAGITGEWTLVRKSGERFPALFTAYPVLDAEGTMTAALGVSIDITERKRTEEALRGSEERYRRITQAITDYIYTVRVKNGLPVETVHGPACEAVTGYTSEDFSSDPSLWIRMVPEEDRDIVREQAARILSGEDLKPIEHRIITRNGRMRWVSNTPVVFYDVEGNLVSYDGLIRDITERRLAEEALDQAYNELEKRVQERTAELALANQQLKREIEERKQAEEALRESEAKYRLLIDNLPSVVYRGYADWSVEFMDKKVESVTGYTMEEFNSRQKKWSDLILGEDFVNARKAFVQALKTDKSYVREYRIQHRTGGILWIQDRGYIVCDNYGNIEYVSGVFFDVTERKLLEKTIIQREKLNTLGVIAAEVAHEIRNPLVSLAGFTRRLKQKFSDLPECDVILHESQRLERILSRIRNYLKPVEVHPRACSVNVIINDAVDLLSFEMEARMVMCRLDLCPDVSVVDTDPDILTQIFINLLLNAVEAMDKGGVFEVKTFETDQSIHIEFKNPVSRLSVKSPELLFMPFAEGGESIGLPLCYRLLKDMGGLLSFTTENDYMVFTVSLPKIFFPHNGERR